jgi:hypothetical protein
VEEEKNFIEKQVDAAWKDGEVDLAERLEVYAAAYEEWLLIKAQYDQAIEKRDGKTVKQLKPLIQKGFPQTLEEFEEGSVKVCLKIPHVVEDHSFHSLSLFCFNSHLLSQHPLLSFIALSLHTHSGCCRG